MTLAVSNLVMPNDSVECILLINAVSNEMCVEINATGDYEPDLCEILQYYTEMLPKLVKKEMELCFGEMEE